MTTALVILAVVAALACPLHALLRMRRGRPGCVGTPGTDAANLRDRQSLLSERIRALASDDPRDQRD